jgi:hypothetical protein
MQVAASPRTLRAGAGMPLRMRVVTTAEYQRAQNVLPSSRLTWHQPLA